MVHESTQICCVISTKEHRVLEDNGRQQNLDTGALPTPDASAFLLLCPFPVHAGSSSPAARPTRAAPSTGVNQAQSGCCDGGDRQADGGTTNMATLPAPLLPQPRPWAPAPSTVLGLLKTPGKLTQAGAPCPSRPLSHQPRPSGRLNSVHACVTAHRAFARCSQGAWSGWVQASGSQADLWPMALRPQGPSRSLGLPGLWLLQGAALVSQQTRSGPWLQPLQD